MREDWIECKLRDLVQYSKGKKPSNLVNEKIDNDYKPYINIKAFEKGIIDEYSNDVKANYCVDGDLLMVWDGARAGLVGKAKNGLIGSTLMKIEPKKDVHKELIFYYLKSLFATINTNTKGVGIPHVEPNLLWDSHLLFFPLPEQRAIVKKLESLFSSLDAGVADLKKAQQQLKIYRQAVLRKSLDAKKKKSISELIQNLSQGWSPKCLSENVENDEEWAVIKTTAVQHGEFLPYENKKLPTDLEPREQHQIEVGDILITRAGPRIRVGVCCLVRKTKLKLINCDKVYRIKLKDTVVLPEYFELVLNSPDYLKLINDIKTGSSDSGLNLTQDRFLKLEIPLPSIKEQIEIIKQIESRLSVCDSIEQNIKESLLKAEALRQSILKKAFEGNLLTAQELAECKQAEDYEPASVLLERIKAEQKSPTDNTDKRRKKAIKLR